MVFRNRTPVCHQISHDVTVHSYTDDTQLYVHCKALECATEVRHITACIVELDSWMTSNRLKLNSDKTQFMWVGPQQQLGIVSVVSVVEIPLKDCSVTISHCHMSWRPHLLRTDICDAREEGCCAMFLPPSSALVHMPSVLC